MRTKTHNPAAFPWGLVLMVVLFGGGILLYNQPELITELLGENIASMIGMSTPTAGGQ